MRMIYLFFGSLVEDIRIVLKKDQIGIYGLHIEIRI